MKWLETLLYGIVSGFSEFLPVSSRAHQLLIGRLTGLGDRLPLLNMMVHISVFIAVYFECRNLIMRLKRDRAMAGRRGRSVRPNGLYDIRLIQSASIPMVILLVLYAFIGNADTLLHTALFLIVNGAFILISEHMRHANKSARYMTALDGIILGVCGGLSALPGLSRSGAVISYSVARGAGKENAVNWSLLLSLPALAVLTVLDLYMMISGGIEPIRFVEFLLYIPASAVAFIAGVAAIRFLRFLTVRMDFSGFAYYSWCIALFSFVLYLIV